MRAEMAAATKVGGSDVLYPVGVGAELIAFLEAEARRVVRVVNCDCLAAIAAITVKHGTSVGPSPT